MRMRPAQTLLALTLTAFAAHGCASARAIVTGEIPNQRKSRTANEFILRTNAHEYSIGFLHDQATQTYAVTATALSGSEQEGEPRWLEFSVNGERTRLTRWSKLTQKRVLVTQPFSCSGVLARRCGRAQVVQPRYTWQYPLPAELSASLSAAKHVRATLAVGEIAIVRDLQEDLGWVHHFFQTTASGAAYH